MAQDHWTASEYRQFLETGREPVPHKPKERFSVGEVLDYAADYMADQAAKARKTKYGNRKIDADGITFDSQHEYRVYLWLKARKERGELRWVFVHVPFRFTSGVVYWADFMTILADGTVEAVWDAKSGITAQSGEYVIKKKTLKTEWGIEICEVYQRDAESLGGYYNPAWPIMNAADEGNGF